MENLVIQNVDLRNGEVEVHGYKHAMVQIIAASIAANVPVLIKNVPLVDDTFVLQQIINDAGGISRIQGRELFVDPRKMENSKIDTKLSKKIHGSMYLMPSFAVRFGGFFFGESGGCQIGSSESKGKRPVNHMLDVMERFGIETSDEGGIIIGKKTSHHKEVSIDIRDYSEVKDQSTSPNISGATKTALLCSIGNSKTLIYHPYSKTDVQDLVRFLRKCHYKVDFSKNFLCIQRPDSVLHDSCIEFNLTECVSEIMTYICLAIHADIELMIKVKEIELIKKGLNIEFHLLEKMGINLQYSSGGISVRKPRSIKSIDIDVTNDTIQSDHHPFFALMLLKADNRSRIREFVWKDRFAYSEELKKLGADFIRDKNVLHICPSELGKGKKTLVATDTRAAAILIIGSLNAEMPIEIENIHHLHRGYENFLGSLEYLGVKLVRKTVALV